jgi:hypothetical protein
MEYLSRWRKSVASLLVFLAAGALGLGAGAGPAPAARVVLTAVYLSAPHGHSAGGGGGGGSARLYAPAHPVQIGSVHYAAVHGTRVSEASFAVGALSSCGYPDVCFQGGTVQTRPRVYLVFWGTWWHCTGAGCVNCPTSSTGCGDQNSLTVENDLYAYWHQVGRPGESHSTITSQYYAGGGQHPAFGFKNGVYGNHCSTDGFGNCGEVAWQQNPPSGSPTAAQIARMASTAANYFGLQSNSNAQIVVLTPKGDTPMASDGSSFPSWCAYHDSLVSSSGSVLSYTLMPWLPDASSFLGGDQCDANFNVINPILDGWYEVGGHEFVESVTDPRGDGYVTPQPGNPSNNEIGDRCGFHHAFNERMPDGSTYKQQQVWSNIEHACVDSMPAGAITGDHGKCVDNAAGHSANGNKIEIWTCNKTGAQLIFYTPSSGHLIVNGGCLDVSGGSRRAGAKVIWYHCGTGDNEKWAYDANSQQWQVYRGLGGLGAMCLDDPNSSAVNGTQLQIYDCNGTAAQKWHGPAE